MARVAVNASPFNCRWIARGSEARISNWSYALCLRVRDEPRLVSEAECARCLLWEPACQQSDVEGS
jgi:hypothetical protein